MNLYKRLGMAALLVCLAGTIFAIDIGRFGDIDDILYDYENGIRTEFEQELMDELITLWEKGDLRYRKDEILGLITDEILDYVKEKHIAAYANPQELIRGFADASVFASHSATQRAFGDYKNLALTFGVMAGIRLPGGILHPVDDLINAGNKIPNQHDISAGANLQAVNSQLAINTSTFLLDGLYLGICYTFLSTINVEGFSLKAYTLGLVAHYQIIKSVNAGNEWERAFRWRGLTVGTGLLYSNTALTGSLELNDFATYGFTASRPKFNLDITVATYTIPLEIYTSALVFWFINIPFGFGIDLAFGKSTASLSMDTTILYEGQPLNNVTDGAIHIDGGGSMTPSLINPKIMTGIGLKLGPVFLDIPINYYFYAKGSGLSIGFTLALTL